VRGLCSGKGFLFADRGGVCGGASLWGELAGL